MSQASLCFGPSSVTATTLYGAIFGYGMMTFGRSPPHVNLSFLTSKLTGSSPNNSLSSAFLFLPLSVNPHTRLRSNFTSCSAFISHVSLPYIRQLSTQLVHALHSIFDSHLFPSLWPGLVEFL